MRIFLKFIFLVSLFPFYAFTTPVPSTPAYLPWFTGPFLDPTPTNAEPGHPYLQSALLISNIYGSYNDQWKLEKQPTFWSINPFLDFGMGFTKRLGVEIISGPIFNFSHQKSATHLQDTILYFGYQLTIDKKNSWIPNIRLMIEQILPTGNYQKFNPQKIKIEATGEGSFQTGPVIAVQKLINFTQHFLSVQFSAGYLFPSKVHVKGFNTYGGDKRTRGKVQPGQSFFTFFSGEYSINQHFAFTLDYYFIYQAASCFSGNTKNSVGLKESYQFSLSPTIEYNFSANSGLNTGFWASVAGKNEEAFASFFLAYVYQF